VNLDLDFWYLTMKGKKEEQQQQLLEASICVAELSFLSSVLEKKEEI